MNDHELARAKREQFARRRLGIDSPRCACCGVDDVACLEAHHLAGRKYEACTVILCRNCHRRVSDWQEDHPRQIGKPPSPDERLMHFLLGMADLFEFLVIKLREFAEFLRTRLSGLAEVAS